MGKVDPLSPASHHAQKINSKRITDLSVEGITITMLEENLCDLG